jgi:hypothetical protein
LEADSRVAIEAIQHFQRNNPLMFLVLTRMKPDNTLSPHLSNMHINVILPFKLALQAISSFLVFGIKLSRVHVQGQCHNITLLFDGPADTRRKGKSVKLHFFYLIYYQHAPLH